MFTMKKKMKFISEIRHVPVKYMYMLKYMEMGQLIHRYKYIYCKWT